MSAKNMIAAGLALAAMIFAPAALADENVKGWGAYTCNSVLEQHDDSDQTMKNMISHGAAQWMLGYFSARNLALPEGQQKELKNMGILDVLGQIDEACDGNPDKMLFTIAEEIWRDLPAYEPPALS